MEIGDNESFHCIQPAVALPESCLPTLHESSPRHSSLAPFTSSPAFLVSFDGVISVDLLTNRSQCHHSGGGRFFWDQQGHGPGGGQVANSRNRAQDQHLKSALLSPGTKISRCIIIAICKVHYKRANLRGEVSAVLGAVIHRSFEIHFDGHKAYRITAQYPCEV